MCALERFLTDSKVFIWLAAIFLLENFYLLNRKSLLKNE